MTHEVCITQYVFGSYTRYIPAYIYSILTAYPDYFVKIFVAGKLSQDEAAALSLMPNGNFAIVEGYQADKVRKGVLPKYVRRLIPQEEFADFKYVYNGDVDFIIIPETPSLKDWHVDHCAKLGLPFSNAIRPGTQRISGLHFIEVAPYYEAIGERLAYYRDHYKEVEAQLVRSSDEWFSYTLLDEVFGLAALRAEGFNRPEHGVHLALWRKSVLVKKTMHHRIDYFLENVEPIRAALCDGGLWDVLWKTNNGPLLQEMARCREFFLQLTPDMKEAFSV